MTKIQVHNNNQKIRIDKFLCQYLNKNRNTIDKFFDLNDIYLNKELVTKKGTLVVDNDIIEFEQKTVVSESKKINSSKIDIVFEDKDIIVVNKPKHMLVHPTSFHEQDSLVQILSKKIKVKDFEDQTRPGVVHRLDRDTNGLIVLAKNKKTYESLLKQLENKTIVRKYLALVHNNFQDKYLLINVPIERSKTGNMKMVASDDSSAKPSQTEIEVLENYSQGALIECHLLTGRTHQIRVHLSYIKHPIYNDELYGKYDGYKDYGQFLCAHFLSFIHPTTNELMKFQIKMDKTFLSLKTKLLEGKNV